MTTEQKNDETTVKFYGRLRTRFEGETVVVTKPDYHESLVFTFAELRANVDLPASRLRNQAIEMARTAPISWWG